MTRSPGRQAPSSARQWGEFRGWIGVSLSVLMLIGIAVAGVLFNRSALRAADDVHRTDSRALGRNNTTLASQFQLLSAKELNEYGAATPFALTANSADDRKRLLTYVTESDYFKYGAALTDLQGNPLTTSRDQGLPTATDPALATLRTQLLAGQPGFSSVVQVAGTALTAVAVPIVKNQQPVAVLLGFSEQTKSQLQAYVVKLSAPGDLITIADPAGRILAATDPKRIGTAVDAAVLPMIANPPADNFVEYQLAGTDMIALVVGGLPGGWAYVRTQTRESFDGPVQARSLTTTVALLAMLFIAVLGIVLLGFRIQLQHQRAQQRFRALFQHAPDVVAVLDVQGRAVYASPSAVRLLDLDAEEGEKALLGVSIFDLVHPEDAPRLRGAFARLIEQPDGVLRTQSRLLTKDKSVRWLELTASNQRNNPSLNGVVINARDVTESRQFQDRLAYEAQHDSLTGLPNRRRMHEQLRRLLRDQPVGVLFIDLDGFKSVNDEYGHQAGDDLLRLVTDRMRAHLRPGDSLSRVGGDEFVVLLPGMVRWFEADDLGRKMRAALEEPLHIGSDTVLISASIGVHVATPADNPDHVLRAADHAMYAIKKSGGGRAQEPRQVPRQRPPITVTMQQAPPSFPRRDAPPQLPTHPQPQPGQQPAPQPRPPVPPPARHGGTVYPRQ